MGKGQITITEETKKVDVYSYALLIYEILTGTPAWGKISFPELVHCFRTEVRPNLPQFIKDRTVQDKVESKHATNLIRIMEDSWVTDMASRPSFSEIISRLQGAE